MTTPIALFTYNRPWHTKRTVEALRRNELASKSDFIIFSDGPKNCEGINDVNEVRKFLKTITGFKSITIIERDENWGLANNIIDGVTKIVNEHGKVIVLEDDLVTSSFFLKYMNETLEMYQNEDMVASVHGYVYPINGLPDTFFIRGADCWGWGTWKRAWDFFEADGGKLLLELKKRKLVKEVNFNNSFDYTKMLKDQIVGKNNSWAVRWYISAFLNDMLTLYPGQSLVENIGNDNSGTHCGISDVFNVSLSVANSVNKITVIEDLMARKKFEFFFKSIKVSFVKKVKLKIKKLLM